MKRYTWFLVVCTILVASGIGLLTALSIAHSDQAPILPDPPLKDLAAKHQVELGNFAILTHIHEAPYNQILTSQFNVALIDNTPNWYFTDGGLRPSPTDYNFKNMDKVVAYAESNHMTMQAHHLVWGDPKWLPGWLKNGHYSKAQLLAIMHDHIQTVVHRYAGQIQEWSVVNEAFARSQHMYGNHDWWADNTGDMSYIDQAFIWAHQADPHAKLLLNDFGNEGINAVSDAEYAYVKSAKARGIPIDGVGMQMHIDGTHPPQKDEVIQNMQRFGQLGVQVYVTEFDVNMNNLKADDHDKDQVEGDIYYEMMRACIESKVCHSFSILGITDKETWYSYMGLGDARPLPFDKQYSPKPAFYSLRAALQQD